MLSYNGKGIKCGEVMNRKHVPPIGSMCHKVLSLCVDLRKGSFEMSDHGHTFNYSILLHLFYFIISYCCYSLTVTNF